MIMRRVTDGEIIDSFESARYRRLTRIALGLGRTAVGFGLAFVWGVSPLSFAQNYQYQAAPNQAPPDYPPPAAYPSPPGYPPPPAYAEAPPPPPGAVWVGAPGQCLYGNGQVYWCAPGVVFDGFPPEWDFVRFPVLAFGPEIIVDPIWFERWRVGHPGFAFRGRVATEGERRAFAEHRGEIIRNGALHAREVEAPRPRRPEEGR
jgi:hypothetical protein